MKEHPYQETLRNMSLNDLLEEMDEYGEAHYIIHEAAKRIRFLELVLLKHKIELDPSSS